MKKKFVVKIVMVMMVLFGVFLNGEQIQAAKLSFNPDNADVLSIMQGNTIRKPQLEMGREYLLLDDCKWNISDTSIANVVEEDGIEYIKGLKPGKTTIIAKYKGKKAVCTLKVFEKIKMPQVKILSTEKEYKLRMTNPNDSAMIVYKGYVSFMGNGDFMGKIKGGKSVEIAPHKSATFSVTTFYNYWKPENIEVAVKYKGNKFTLELPRKKGKAKISNEYWTYSFSGGGGY